MVMLMGSEDGDVSVSYGMEFGVGYFSGDTLTPGRYAMDEKEDGNK